METKIKSKTHFIPIIFIIISVYPFFFVSFHFLNEKVKRGNSDEKQWHPLLAINPETFFLFILIFYTLRPIFIYSRGCKLFWLLMFYLHMSESFSVPPPPPLPISFHNFPPEIENLQIKKFRSL